VSRWYVHARKPQIEKGLSGELQASFSKYEKGGRIDAADGRWQGTKERSKNVRAKARNFFGLQGEG